MIFTLSVSNIFLFRESSLSDVRNEAYSSGFALIDNLTENERYIEAYQLANSYHEKLPKDSLVLKKLNQSSLEVNINSKPEGASIFYSDLDSDEWVFVGKTPTKARIPGINSGARGYIKFKLAKEGYKDYLSLTTAGLIGRVSFNKEKYSLIPISHKNTNMVQVPKGPTRLFVSELGDLNIVNLESYWIDKYEVTNEQYQSFINAGGYKREYWDIILNEDGNTISWEQGMSIFVDKSGLNGPSTWTNGTYEVNKKDFPVLGISWYEARAYAKWAGKSLPTIYHWYKSCNVLG